MSDDKQQKIQKNFSSSEKKKKKKEKRKDIKDKEPRPKIKKINHSSSVRD